MTNLVKDKARVAMVDWMRLVNEKKQMMIVINPVFSVATMGQYRWAMLRENVCHLTQNYKSYLIAR